MINNDKRINQKMIICCNIIVAALLIACGIAVLGEEHTWKFTLMFVTFAVVLVTLCAILYLYRKLTRQSADYLNQIEHNNEQIHEMTLSTITTIVNLIDAKDEYTKGHSTRVGEYAAVLASELGWDEEQTEKIKYVGVLHDIGKVGIPDSILNRPHNLSDVEFEIMQSHVTKGAAIVKGEQIVEDMVEGVLYHHERYDGKGYPEGLAGEKIPLVARIISVADAYDAMTSNRAYRKRMSEVEVIEELRASAGKQFDPEIVETFCKMLEQGRIENLSPDLALRNTERFGEKSTRLLQSVLELKKEVENQNEQLDYVTEAYNRNYGERKIADLIRASKGKGALAIVEFTNVRDINKEHGFIIGDRILKVIANCLKEHNEYAILVRYSGGRLIYYMPNLISEHGVAQELQYTLEEIKHVLREEYNVNNAMIAIGASVLRDADTEYMKLFEEADKALYYVNQLRKDGCYVYRHHEEKMVIDKVYTKKDFNNVLEDLVNHNTHSDTYEVKYPEFEKLYDFIKKTCARNDQEIQLVMLTLLPSSENQSSIEERDQAVGILEKVINTSLRQVDVMVRFSSMQCLIFMMDINREQLDVVIKRLMSNFYRIYEKGNMELSYELSDFDLRKELKKETN